MISAIRISALVVVSMAGAAFVQTSATPVRFTAQAQNLSTAINMPAQSPLEITVTRWSTDSEREQLIAGLKEEGTQGLLHMLQKAERIGSIRIPSSLAYEFRFAMRTVGRDGVEHITLITDRPIGFWEAVDKPRTLDYRFMVVELQINPGGRGQGRLSVATRITADRLTGEIGLATWENQVVTLRSVQRARQ